MGVNGLKCHLHVHEFQIDILQPGLQTWIFIFTLMSRRHRKLHRSKPELHSPSAFALSGNVPFLSWWHLYLSRCSVPKLQASSCVLLFLSCFANCPLGIRDGATYKIDPEAADFPPPPLLEFGLNLGSSVMQITATAFSTLHPRPGLLSAQESDKKAQLCHFSSQNNTMAPHFTQSKTKVPRMALWNLVP